MYITTTTDASRIASMHKLFHDAHVELHPTIFKPFELHAMEQHFQALVQQPTHSFFLLYHDEHTPIGYAWVEWMERAETPFMFAQKTMFIHQISIEDDYRGNGNGNMLLEYITEEAKKRNFLRIELSYWLTNFGAKYFYRKHDFIPFAERVYKQL